MSETSTGRTHYSNAVLKMENYKYAKAKSTQIRTFYVCLISYDQSIHRISGSFLGLVYLSKKFHDSRIFFYVKAEPKKKLSAISQLRNYDIVTIRHL